MAHYSNILKYQWLDTSGASNNLGFFMKDVKDVLKHELKILLIEREREMSAICESSMTSLLYSCQAAVYVQKHAGEKNW